MTIIEDNSLKILFNNHHYYNSLKLEKIVELLSLFLKKQRYHVPARELAKRVLSDPGNEILAISNTLDYFNIENLVAEVPKLSIPDLPDYFIAKIGYNLKSSIVLVEKEGTSIVLHFDNEKSEKLSYNQFSNQWNGLIIAIEKNKNVKRATLKKELIGIFSAFCALAGILFIGVETHSFLKVSYFFFSILGLALSILINKEKYTSISFQSGFCSISKDTNCRKVLESNSAIIFQNINLSDLSVIYFSFLIASFLYFPNSAIYLFLGASSLPAIIYSIYSQYFNVKSWCPLCLGISAVLLLQFGISVVFFQGISFKTSEVLFMVMLTGTLILTWTQIKYFLSVYQKYHKLDVENLSFRRNHQLFLAYYNTLERLENIESLESIKFGVENPTIRITIITNPLCKACKETHGIYNELLDLFPDDLEIQLLFLVPNKHRHDFKTLVSEGLLEIYFEKGTDQCWQALNEWYESLNVEEWMNKWNGSGSEVYNEIITTQVEWCLSNGLDSTPFILINGRKLPPNYRADDLKNFIEPVIRSEQKENKDFMHEETEALDVLK